MKAKTLSVRKYIIIMIFLVSVLIGFWLASILDNNKNKESWADANRDDIKIRVYRAKNPSGLRVREITAYNVGDPSQTDSSPCIGAWGDDLCAMADMGIPICAANFVPRGTLLSIDSIGSCMVMDRMSKKYRDRVDLAMSKENKKEALAFGIKRAEVGIINYSNYEN